MRWIAIFLLFTTPAAAAEWRAADGSTISIYGAPNASEWEAFVGDTYCTPTGGPDGKQVMVLYCDGAGDKGEQLSPSRSGVTFRGKQYRLAPAS